MFGVAQAEGNGNLHLSRPYRLRCKPGQHPACPPKAGRSGLTQVERERHTRGSRPACGERSPAEILRPLALAVCLEGRRDRGSSLGQVPYRCSRRGGASALELEWLLWVGALATELLREQWLTSQSSGWYRVAPARLPLERWPGPVKRPPHAPARGLRTPARKGS